MTEHLTRWATEQPWPTAGAGAALLLLLAAGLWLTIRALRRLPWPPLPVMVAAAGAAVCTAYTADTSWRFAAHELDMKDTTERIIMFAAAELALLACAVMARANKQATATATAAGSPGVPGILVWVITGVQIIPAYSESGIVGGTVRAIIGPVMAGLLWHLAMGLEIRVARPEALSTGLPAVIGRELRERLLSYLGLAARDRTAEQIARDRAMSRAVRLASRPRLGGWGRRRLAAAVARARVGTDGEQRHRLLQDLAARRTSYELATVPLPSPWTGTPASAEPYQSTPLGVTGAQLRRLEPIDALERVRAAHPHATPAELAALCTQYGVPVSETQVRIATRAGFPPPAPRPVKAVPARRVLAAAPGPVLRLELRSTPEVHPEVRCRVPALAAGRTRTQQIHVRVPDETEPPADEGGDTAPAARVPAPGPSAVPEPDAPAPGVPELLRRARQIDAAHRQKYGRVASIRVLKKGLGVGQPTAEEVQALLLEPAVPTPEPPPREAVTAGRREDTGSRISRSAEAAG
ncbi:hypothetical protein ACWGI0_23140 [Streptomyces sp. NPDC054802]